MENPQTWGAAEKVVARALAEAELRREKGTPGLSVARQITDALRDSGLLLDPERQGNNDDASTDQSGSGSETEPG